MMTPLNYIAMVFISIGIASDNLILSGMSSGIASAIRNRTALLILFMLLTIQMQAFFYGAVLAKLINHNAAELNRYIALSVLAAINFKMAKDIRTGQRNYFPFGLNGFLGIAVTTFLYVVVLGFALHALNVPYQIALPVSMTLQSLMLLLGWYGGKQHWVRTLSWIRWGSLMLMAAGLALFLTVKTLRP